MNLNRYKKRQKLRAKREAWEKENKVIPTENNPVPVMDESKMQVKDFRQAFVKIKKMYEEGKSIEQVADSLLHTGIMKPFGSK